MSAGQPSQLFLDYLGQIRAAAALGPVVDLACGRGRHALAAAREGLPVVAIDRNAESLAELRATARAEGLDVDIVRADLETGGPIPLAPGRCGAILVFRYLHRPIAGELVAALAPGGLLLYETFTIHQRELGYGPRRDAFLLQPGELPRLFPELEVSHHWEGRIQAPREAHVAQLVARRPL
jgi:SAM-dependent methyltransferase